MAYTDCEKCEKCNWEVACSCGSKYCELCFHNSHLQRNPDHRREANKKSHEFWKWVSGKLADLANALIQATEFRKDEGTKWFGLHAERRDGPKITSIVETDRLTRLMEYSVQFRPDSPGRQFPSITSFVGETGAGKSMLSTSWVTIPALGLRIALTCSPPYRSPLIVVPFPKET